ncbi:MAG: tRNA (adenosine(37)-N6)-threonylcarbamoyltransferase complex ATPase subunit type 1 TsaE [Candidatus Omnitrophota bacterium]
MKKIITRSGQDTIKLAEKFGRKLKRGDVVALVGDLGSGKTTFTKGIARGLGVKNTRYINSPSFVIIKEYKGKVPLYHFDVYRLDDVKDLEDLGYEEYFYADGVCVVEWADKIKSLLPKAALEVRFKFISENEREIILL